jgi:3-keto-disaccharide hydrolase
MKTICIVTAVVALLLGGSGDADAQKKTWSFDDAVVGKLPVGWSSARTGRGAGSVWKVVRDKSAPSGANVLAQTSSDGPGRVFNLCLADPTRYRDFDLSVSFKANTGNIDQGGGPVWRFQDANNYYICRMNPLEDNFRVYKVVAGKRIQLASLDIEALAGKWHAIRVGMHGDHITCSVNGKKLDVHDDSIDKPGKVGLWTKADAATSFDDLSVSTKGQE